MRRYIAEDRWMNFRDVQELYALAKYVTGKNGVALLREILL